MDLLLCSEVKQSSLSGFDNALRFCRLLQPEIAVEGSVIALQAVHGALTSTVAVPDQKLLMCHGSALSSALL